MKKTRRDIEAVVEALDDLPIEPEEAALVVKSLGIDVKQLASKLRGAVTDADERDRKKRFEEASLAYAAELERLERIGRVERQAPLPPREVQLATMRQLLQRAPQQSVSMHFHKYETATDEELAELIRSLQHLLGDGEHE